VLVWIAVMLPVLLAFAAIVVDVGMGFLMKRHLQGAADAAALAAAHELADCAATDSIAHLYSGEPAAKNEWSSLPTVTTQVFYATAADPTPDGPCVEGEATKVRVVQTATSPVYFAGIFGVDGKDVYASATASRGSTTSGTPLAIYVHEVCGASTGNKGLIAGGMNMTVEGGIHVNGHLEIKNSGFVSQGPATVYRPPLQGDSPADPDHPQGPGCKTLDQSDTEYCTDCAAGPSDEPADGPWRDWVTPYHSAAILKGFTPCTINHTGDAKYENVPIPSGVHCLPPGKKFTVTGNSSGNITVIADFIEVGGTGALSPYNNTHPVLFYSTNTAGTAIKLNPSLNYDWSGYIINRFGGIEINAASVSSPQDGLLEAEWIDINGENFNMLGTFTDSPDGSTFGGVSLDE
jgi:Flp pilus assembly protein TadG